MSCKAFEAIRKKKKKSAKQTIFNLFKLPDMGVLDISSQT
jgi:hypothetical protein